MAADTAIYGEIMYTEIEKKTLDINLGSIILSFRYTNGAFLQIEKSGYNPFDVLSISHEPAAVRCFLSAGLAESLGEYAEETANKLMKLSEYAQTLIVAIQEAIILALPIARVGVPRAKGENNDMELLFTYYCDIMGRSDEEFWTSTLREVTERWERYATAEGRIKAPEKFERFDD